MFQHRREPPRLPEYTELFALGCCAGTARAAGALIEAGCDPSEILMRHVLGFWGDLPSEDREANERALESGGRIMSRYALPTGKVVWVVTEADREYTTLLLPEEY